jgi:phosphopantothenoylcysteine decarboxylase/phosphopantothenate--cysteine ligase
MPGAGFGVDTNIVKLIFPDRKIIDLPLMEKTRLADRILDEILILRSRRSNVHK